ncbi:hypothetical protein J4234_03695 [Candidatus Woesearchaeota archaeon]|nr:hypothetical protein [Candidatus Woesearchaeota archaeon]
MAKFNFYLGATASSWLLAILIIAAELYGPFKNLLKSTFSHHWIGKGIIITIVFLAFGFLLRNKESIANLSDKKLAWHSILGSLIVIFLFYIMEFFK